MASEAVLQKLDDWQPPGPGRQTLFLLDEPTGQSVAIAVDRRDEVGFLIWEIVLKRGPAAGATIADWAQALAARVSGLLESLKVVEVDTLRDQAQLRSATPTRRGDRPTYFELMLHGTTDAVMARFQAPVNGARSRTQVPFPLTIESLAKLISDLMGL
jgi:hypothetical protein